MTTVNEGDVYDVVWTIRQEDGTPFNLTGSTVTVEALPLSGGAAVPLAVTVPDPPTGEVVHELTGTLPTGSYSIVAKVVMPTGDVAYTTESLTVNELGSDAVPLPINPTSQTCPWPALYIGCDGGECDAFDQWGPDEALAKATFEAMATDWLWNLTGQVFGVCETTVHPCRDDCAGYDHQSTFWGRGPGFDIGFPRAGGAGWMPVLLAGKWFNISCGSCLGTCTCAIDACYALSLPGPIQSITSIVIDGETLDPSTYRVDNHRTVVRLDGQCWPACQDLLHPTFTIVYEKGIPVPVGGQVAVGRLACELALQACDDDRCALPSNLVALSRQGITANFEGELRDGWSGIPAIDNWVTQVNQPRQFASVRSVDSR